MRQYRTAAVHFAGGCLLLLLSACGSVPLQSEHLLAEPPTDISTRVELEQVPFNPQEKFQCGPAALATLYQHHGLEVSAEALTPEVYLPDKKGSLQLELISNVRRHKLLPYLIDKEMSALLKEVQAGNPVLVLQNLGLSWAPQWHYAVVIGFDLELDQLYLRSGTRRRHINNLSLFERTWRRAGYWAMLAMPLDRLPATADPFHYLSTAVAFEKLDQPEQARTAYYTALERWPRDRNLLMAAANIDYRLHHTEQAEHRFLSIIERWPDYAPALNNLAQIRLEQGNYQEAETLAGRAVSHGGRFRELYQQTLNEIQRLQGFGTDN